MAELDIWLTIIEDQGLTGWLAFYQATLHHPVSNTDLFGWAIETYGQWPMVEAILAANKKHVKDDPLNYVIFVAQAKWKEQYTDGSSEDKYKRGLERTKIRVMEQNEKLEEKLERARSVDKSKSKDSVSKG